jgi:hypothetical protein
LDIGVLDYIGILYHKEHPPEVWHSPPGTPVYKSICIYIRAQISRNISKYPSKSSKMISVHPHVDF